MNHEINLWPLNSMIKHKDKTKEMIPITSNAVLLHLRNNISNLEYVTWAYLDERPKIKKNNVSPYVNYRGWRLYSSDAPLSDQLTILSKTTISQLLNKRNNDDAQTIS